MRKDPNPRTSEGVSGPVGEELFTEEMHFLFGMRDLIIMPGTVFSPAVMGSCAWGVLGEIWLKSVGEFVDGAID